MERIGWRSVAVALLSVLLVSCDRGPGDGITTVTVFGGSSTGAYGKLIDLIDKRAVDLSSVCAARSGQANDETPSSCALAQLRFRPCTTRGSLDNLERLGFESDPPATQQAADSQCLVPIDSNYAKTHLAVQVAEVKERSEAEKKRDEAGKTEEALETEIPVDLGGAHKFALVQSYFIYRANSENAVLPGFKQFEDLRIVLPLYDSVIQIVANSSISAPASATESNPAPACPPVGVGEDGAYTDLLCGKTVFLGNNSSVNVIHGHTFIDRHPLLQKPGTMPVYVCYDSTNAPENGSKPGYTNCLAVEKHGFSAPNAESFTSYQERVDEVLARLNEAGADPKGQQLLACGLIDAYVVSGTLTPPGSLQCKTSSQTIDSIQLRVPELIVDAVLKERDEAGLAYYGKSSTPAVLGLPEGSKSPTVATYLVTSANTNEDVVEAVTKGLVGAWTSLMLLDSKLLPLEENLLRKPVDRHSGAESALIDEELVGDADVITGIALGLLGVSLALYLVPVARYDRMGRRHADFWLLSLRDSGRTIFYIALWLGILTLGVKSVQMLEANHAVVGNLEDRIGSFDFFEAWMWMFTFIASGYENDVFPVDMWARLLVTLLAVAGLALPLWAIIGLFNSLRERSIDRGRGLREIAPQRGHTLICGWNSKGPGLLYTLTCRDSPHRGLIIIVAEIDDELPLKKYGLDRKGAWFYRIGRIYRSRQRVHFLRGSPTSRTMLERAHAASAEVAIVLASDKGSGTGEQPGVLTALAIRKLNPTAFISVELGLKRDREYYAASKVDHIVDPELVSQRMLSMACASRHAVDFALDALSPDEWSEWYSLNASDVARAAGGVRLSARDAMRFLSSYGMTLVGVSKRSLTTTSEVYAPGLSGDGMLDPLVQFNSLDNVLGEDNLLICAAEHLGSFNKARMGRPPVRDTSLITIQEEELRILPPSEASRILVVGPDHRANDLASYLSSNLAGVSVETVLDREEDPGGTDDRIREAVKSAPFSIIVLMSCADDGDAIALDTASRFDAQTILRAEIVSEAAGSSGDTPAPRLIAEVHDIENHQLLRDAGVETIVPTSLLAERFLARQASGRGYVSSMLSAMTSLENGIYFRSLRLDADHPLVGRRFDDLLNTFFTDGRVLGLLPKRREQELANNQEDFEHHFVMSPERDSPHLEPDDVVIVLEYPTSS